MLYPEYKKGFISTTALVMLLFTTSLLSLILFKDMQNLKAMNSILQANKKFLVEEKMIQTFRCALKQEEIPKEYALEDIEISIEQNQDEFTVWSSLLPYKLYFIVKDQKIIDFYY